MTELVIKIDNQNDLHFILDLVKKRGLSVQQKTITTEKTEIKKLQAIIKNGVANPSPRLEIKSRKLQKLYSFMDNTAKSVANINIPNRNERNKR